MTFVCRTTAADGDGSKHGETRDMAGEVGEPGACGELPSACDRTWKLTAWAGGGEAGIRGVSTTDAERRE